jgi:hypothetical protein
MEPADVNVDDATPGPMHLRIAFCSGPDGEVIEFVQKTAK